MSGVRRKYTTHGSTLITRSAARPRHLCLSITGKPRHSFLPNRTQGAEWTAILHSAFCILHSPAAREWYRPPPPQDTCTGCVPLWVEPCGFFSVKADLTGVLYHWKVKLSTGKTLPHWEKTRAEQHHGKASQGQPNAAPQMAQKARQSAKIDSTGQNHKVACSQTERQNLRQSGAAQGVQNGGQRQQKKNGRCERPGPARYTAKKKDSDGLNGRKRLSRVIRPLKEQHNS